MASLTQLNEMEQTQGDSEGQGSLVCCSSWARKESRHDLVTEQKAQHNESSLQEARRFHKPKRSSADEGKRGQSSPEGPWKQQDLR